MSRCGDCSSTASRNTPERLLAAELAALATSLNATVQLSQKLDKLSLRRHGLHAHDGEFPRLILPHLPPVSDLHTFVKKNYACFRAKDYCNLPISGFLLLYSDGDGDGAGSDVTYVLRPSLTRSKSPWAFRPAAPLSAVRKNQYPRPSAN